LGKANFLSGKKRITGGDEMNLSCEVIKDLLPLYHDGVCSKESNAIVEEHLAGCENCMAELEAMDTILPAANIARNLKEAEAIQKLSKRWKKGMWKSVLKGVLFTLIGVVVLFLILYTFMDFRFM
jgi:predicted anti-sigma-YlaC factor YlaD